MSHPSERPNEDDSADDFSIADDPFAFFEGGITKLDEMYEVFRALRSGGFSENQALKFLAFCSIFEGDQ